MEVLCVVVAVVVGIGLAFIVVAVGLVLSDIAEGIVSGVECR